MILLFGGTSCIGREIIKQSNEDIIYVSRGNQINLGNRSNTMMINSSIEDMADKPDSIPIETKKKITTIIFGHRYRPKTQGDNYELEEAINIEVHSPKKIIKSIKESSECLSNILFVSSLAAGYVATEQSDAYGVCKACINKLAQELSVRLSSGGVSVNTVMLGYVKQDRQISRDGGFYQTAEKVIPSKHPPEPKEIADLILGVVKLAKQNRLFTGQIVFGDACLSLQAHSSVAEMSRSRKA